MKDEVKGGEAEGMRGGGVGLRRWDSAGGGGAKGNTLLAEPLDEFFGDGLIIVGVSEEVEVCGLTDEELFFGGDGVVDGELSGWGHGRIESSGGYIGGGLAEACCGGRIEPGQYVHGVAVSAFVEAQGFAAADAGDGHAEGVVAEGGDVDVAAVEAFFPWEGQGAHAAAEAAAEVPEFFEVGIELGECGGGGEEVGDAEAVDVGIA